MRKASRNTKGFSVVELLIVIVVLAVLGGTGFFVYHRSHKTKTVATNTASHQSSTQTPPANPYAGWKSYCDTTNHYCFKYPTDWTADISNANGISGASLQSPSKAIQVRYGNPDPRDGGTIDFTPTHVEKLSAANQDVTIVCGYGPGSAIDKFPVSCRMVDSSLLTTYPLTIGQQGHFAGNSAFTNQGASDRGFGEFSAQPSASIDTAADAEAWLNTTDGQTSLKILQSFYYQK